MESDYVQMVDRLSETKKTKNMSLKSETMIATHHQNPQTESIVKDLKQNLELAEKKPKELTNRLKKQKNAARATKETVFGFIQNEIMRKRIWFLLAPTTYILVEK